MTTVTEFFQVIEVGDGRWTILHDVTGERAGRLLRTRHGYILEDENGSPVGAFSSIESSLRALYEIE
jgi:hypothetical protein